MESDRLIRNHVLYEFEIFTLWDGFVACATVVEALIMCRNRFLHLFL